MTTLRDRPEGETDSSDPLTGHQDVHCPHCGSLMETGAGLPWPTEPVPCGTCERWVGRARAVPGSSAPTAEPEPEHSSRGNGNGRGPQSRRQRRSSRPGPRQRRRARELGPPPVPRFLSTDEPEPSPSDHDDLEFAATSAWDAPPAESHASAQAAPPENGVGPESRTEAAHEEDGDIAATALPDTRLAAALPEAELAPPDHEDPLERQPEPSPPLASDDDDFGPPAPFFSPASVTPSPPPPPSEAEGGRTVAPGQDSAEVVIADGASAEPVDAPEEPADRPSSEAGQTIPFWSVPSEPEGRRRRLSLPRLRRPRLRRPRLRRPTRAQILRALPIALLAIGALLLIEGALTVFWKEPFSAIFAAQTQSALGDDLKRLERESAAAAAAAAQSKQAAERYQRRRSVALNRDTGIGEATGRLRVPKIDLSTVVVQGTDDATLQKGPGHYTQTPLPGQKGNWTVGIAGHRTTYDAPFRRINELKRGDEIVYTLPYGRFVYEVEGTKIVDDSDTSVFVPKGYDRIALTACHPLYSAAQRIIAYGRLKSGEPRGAARAAGAPKPKPGTPAAAGAPRPAAGPPPAGAPRP